MEAKLLIKALESDTELLNQILEHFPTELIRDEVSFLPQRYQAKFKEAEKQWREQQDLTLDADNTSADSSLLKDEDGELDLVPMSPERDYSSYPSEDEDKREAAEILKAELLECTRSDDLTILKRTRSKPCLKWIYENLLTSDEQEAVQRARKDYRPSMKRYNEQKLGG